MPESPVRAERVDVADNCALSIVNHRDPVLLQRNVLLAMLLALAAAAWAVLVWQHADVTMDMTASVTLGPRVPLFLVIWVVMMVAMMFPTAAPMILTFHRVQAGNRKLGDAFGTTCVFVAAYLLVWVCAGAFGSAGLLGVDMADVWLAVYHA